MSYSQRRFPTLGIRKDKTPLFLTVESNFRAVLTAGVGVVLCLTIPLTTAYAQAPVPDLTGTVSCVETVSLEENSIVSVVSSKNVYDVEVFGNVIADRWGSGKDVRFGGMVSIERPGKTIEFDPNLDSLPRGLTEIFWTMPVSRYGTCGSDQVCLEMEEVYSETGRWKLKLHEDQLELRGTSFTVMDFPWAGDSEWTTKSAECDWELSGSL